MRPFKDIEIRKLIKDASERGTFIHYATVTTPAEAKTKLAEIKATASTDNPVYAKITVSFCDIPAHFVVEFSTDKGTVLTYRLQDTVGDKEWLTTNVLP